MKRRNFLKLLAGVALVPALVKAIAPRYDEGSGTLSAVAGQGWQTSQVFTAPRGGTYYISCGRGDFTVTLEPGDTFSLNDTRMQRRKPVKNQRVMAITA